MKSLLLIQETARCLLCHEAPCSAVCPSGLMPDKRIRSLVFENEKAAFSGILNQCTACGACEKNCIRGKLDYPVKITQIIGELASIEMSTMEKQPDKREGAQHV